MDFALREGMSFVELRCLEGVLLNPVNCEVLLPKIRPQVEIRVLDTSARLFSGDAKAWAEVAAMAPFADACGARWMRVFDGELDAGSWLLAEQRWREWQALRAQAGWKVDVLIETHWGLCGPLEARLFRDKLPAAGVVWDMHHTWRAGGEMADTWDVLGAVVKHVHLKDSVLRCKSPQAVPESSYCLPGRGDFPWAEAGALLRSSGYAGGVCLEWERFWHPTLPPLTEALPAFLSMRF